jgi:hypothetical protein
MFLIMTNRAKSSFASAAPLRSVDETARRDWRARTDVAYKSLATAWDTFVAALNVERD